MRCGNMKTKQIKKRKIYKFQIEAIKQANELNKTYKQTWKHNKVKYADTVNCELCGKKINLKFKKDGIPCDNTKLYKMGCTKQKGIYYQHRAIGVCSFYQEVKL